MTYDITSYIACHMTYDITCYIACYICSGAVALNRHYLSLQICAFGVHGGPAWEVRS